MKFYYEAEHNFARDCDFPFFCSADQELKKHECLIVDLGPEHGIVTAFVKKQVDPLYALTSNERIIEVIYHCDLSEYRKKQEASAQANILLRTMEDKMKGVKLIESIRKIAGIDPELSDLLASYEKVNKKKSTSSQDSDYVSD